MEIVAACAGTTARCSVEWRPPSGRLFAGCALRRSVATVVCVFILCVLRAWCLQLVSSLDSCEIVRCQSAPSLAVCGVCLIVVWCRESRSCCRCRDTGACVRDVPLDVSRGVSEEASERGAGVN